MKALRKEKHMLCLERSRLSKENWPKSLPKSLKREKNTRKPKKICQIYKKTPVSMCRSLFFNKVDNEN